MLEHLNLLERRTQDEVIRLLKEELGYRFIGNLDIDVQKFNIEGDVMPGKQQKANNTNIRVNDFVRFQKEQGWTDRQAEQGYNNLRQLAGDCHRYHELYTANERVYNMLTSFTTVNPTKEQPNKKTMDLILWDKPEKNDFAFAEEVSGPLEREDNVLLAIHRTSTGDEVGCSDGEGGTSIAALSE